MASKQNPFNANMKRHLAATTAIIALTIVVIVILYIGLGIDQAKIPNTIEGKPAYPFTVSWIQGKEFLPETNSEKFNLDAFKGKPLILNFWASWCVSCRSEAHELEAFWQKHRSDGVIVAGIAIQDSKDAAQKFAAYFGKTYILGLDDSGDAAIDYGVTGVPETFIINRQGIVVHKEVGPVDREILEKHLPEIL